MPTSTLPLRDIHLPDAISAWPPALGWWCVAVLIPVCIVLAVLLFKRLTRKTPVRVALALLKQIKQNAELSPQQKITELSILLRRVAISVSPVQEAASLTGDAWLHYLDSFLPSPLFSQGLGRCLADKPYQPANTESMNAQQLAELLTIVETWLNACAKSSKRRFNRV
ncbi:DUF4381 domain-containing protein [Methylocucumis oryzae]|uniref:DUF4381 domain-containing protein n=1 Tax=Methylocucumis oryzae TaxID=1632867 RepID=A0A0F3IG87_9GAMM|nr:DUF4381 domain-containing protein [Methylocucumis oryzae]KJV05815.1 hypothetical protein VZ94_15475 [Methylocucumis oryzae]